MRAPLRVLWTVVSASALTLGLLGCSGDPAEEEDARAASPSAGHSPPTSTERPGEEPTSSASTAPGAGPEVAPFLARLEEGFGDEGTVHVRMTVSGAADLSAEGDTSYGPDGSDMRLTVELSGPAGAITMLAVDDEVFLSMPRLTPEGKYFRVPADSPALAGFDSAALSPTDLLAGFEAGLLEVVEKGDDDVDGETTERYELHLDPDLTLAAMGSEEPPAGLPETLVYDVWLDSEDRMRRLEYAVAETEVTLDMTRWGEVEPVTAPDEADVVDAPGGF